MSVNWTLNVSDILIVSSFLAASGAVLWKFQGRLIVIETWKDIKVPLDNEMLTLHGKISEQLAKIMGLVEGNEKRIDALEDRLNRHHEDVTLHGHRAS